ncbi:MAG: helix-turn-helix transcriptional regulator, partial [Mobilicoccus sp.]|nr:helix-turn-helix transcriptional regulator [Mobilicoccus sp.]
FRTGEGLLRVPRRLLDRRLDTGDALLHEMAMTYLETHGREHAATVSGQVSRVLANSLGTSPPLIGSVANLLAMHPRTLQRRLAAEGTTFEEVLDEVRRERAHRLIVTTDLPLRQVAGMVGLSEPAALTRACRRWFGMPPRELRRGATYA